jgi:hypothetical protein
MDERASLCSPRKCAKPMSHREHTATSDVEHTMLRISYAQKAIRLSACGVLFTQHQAPTHRQRARAVPHHIHHALRAPHHGLQSHGHPLEARTVSVSSRLKPGHQRGQGVSQHALTASAAPPAASMHRRSHLCVGWETAGSPEANTE